MRVLITGNMGYIGTVLGRHLRETMHAGQYIGFDAGFFADCTAGPCDAEDRALDAQYRGDVRQLPAELLDGVDTVIHLAAVSNDPMGARFEAATAEINLRAAERIAAAACARGVSRFVLASSCSLYGRSAGGPRRETDSLDPLTAYARSKAELETRLERLATDRFTVTSLRLATACGWSPRLRLDLVLNDFVASALATGRITVLSDGSPWRPLIDVRDIARAFEWAMQRGAAQGGAYVAVNVGTDAANCRVGDLARRVAAVLGGCTVTISGTASPDDRSYQVDFSRFRELAPGYQPREDVDSSIHALSRGLRDMGFSNAQFRQSCLVRLRCLTSLIEDGSLDDQLRWVRPVRTMKALHA